MTFFDGASDQDDEIGWLDLLLVVAQNLRLLVLGPLVAGAVAVGGAYFVPAVYESVAVQVGDATLAAMYDSAQVRDAVVQKAGYLRVGEASDVARARLESDLRVAVNSKDRTISIISRADTPQAAQLLAQAAIEQAALLNKSRLENLKRLEIQYEMAVKRERDYAASAELVTKRIQSERVADQASLIQVQARLLDAAREAQAVTANLASELHKAETYELLQAPTLPSLTAAPKKAAVFGVAAIAAGLILLVIVFGRSALQKVGRNQASASKLQTLNRALRKAVGIS